MEDSQEMMNAALGRAKPGRSWEFIVEPEDEEQENENDK